MESIEEDNISDNISDNINYKSNFICTYNLISDYDDSLVLYQVQLLQSFELKHFDDNTINDVTEKLFNKFKTNKYIINLLHSDNFSKDDIFINDDLSKFRTYFGYDTFYAFHNLLRELMNINIIDEKNYNLLVNK